MRFDVVGVNINHLVQLSVSLLIVLQFQFSQRQLVMGLSIFWINLQGLLELNHGRIVLLLLHILLATLYVLALGGCRVTSATDENDGQYSYYHKDDVAVTHAFS